MQFGQHTFLSNEPCSVPVSLPATLATLIYGQSCLSRETASLENSDGNVIIWLDLPTIGRRPIDPGGHGIIIVTHDANQAVGARPFIISYPVEVGSERRQLGAVADILVTMGWSLLSFNRKEIDGGHADVAYLVIASRFGCEQKLWLAEPVAVLPEHVHALV